MCRGGWGHKGVRMQEGCCGWCVGGWMGGRAGGSDGVKKAGVCVGWGGGVGGMGWDGMGRKGTEVMVT